MVLCLETRKPEWVWNILLVSESNDTFKNVKDRISILKRERGQHTSGSNWSSWQFEPQNFESETM